MSKTVLVLTGSPRKNGNTDMLADAFIKGAASKGHETIKFKTAEKVVKGCRACNLCWSGGEACVFEDGFRELAPLLARADVLAIASPVYFFGMTAQVKAAIDKMYSFMVPASKQKLKLKESVLLMCAEDTRRQVFDGSVGTYRGIIDYLELRDRGMITVDSVNLVGDIAGHKALEEAESLGASL